MHRLSTIKLAALAIVGAVAASVPATQGPTAAPALAGPGCGGHEERPCIWPLRRCDRGMVLHQFNSRARGVCRRDDGPPPIPPRYDGRTTPTGVSICNKSNTREIFAALAYFDWGTNGGRPNWTSMGWWLLQRGECNEIRVPDDGEPYDGRIYLMAVGGGLAWEGNGGGFCVDRDSEFRIVDADLARCTDDNTLYGIEFHVTPGQLNHFDFDG